MKTKSVRFSNLLDTFIVLIITMEEQLETFYFKETIDGTEHDYRITMKDCSYGIEKDGILIAEIQCDETWKQIAGPVNLRVAEIELIAERIEDHWE